MVGMTEEQACEMRERLAKWSIYYLVGVYRINGKWCVYAWSRSARNPRIYREYVPATHIISR